MLIPNLLATAARNVLRNGYKKAKPHATPSHKTFIWNPLSSCSQWLPYTVFWHTFYQLFLYNLFLRLPSSVGILTLQNFFFAAISDSNLISLLHSAMPTLRCNFFTPPKHLLPIYSWDNPACVSNHCCLLILLADFIFPSCLSQKGENELCLSSGSCCWGHSALCCWDHRETLKTQPCGFAA